MVNSANALQSPAQALTLGTLRLQLSPTQGTHILEGLGQRPLIEAYLETSEFAEDSKKLRGILTRLLDDGDLGFGGRWQVTGSQMEVTCWIVPMDADGSTWVDAGSNGRQSDLREMHESLFGEDGELVLALKVSNICVCCSAQTNAGQPEDHGSIPQVFHSIPSPSKSDLRQRPLYLDETMYQTLKQFMDRGQPSYPLKTRLRLYQSVRDLLALPSSA